MPWPDVGSFDVTAISFDDLINLERAAVEANDAVKGLPYSAEAWKPWFDASVEFQTKVTVYAKAEGKHQFDSRISPRRFQLQTGPNTGKIRRCTGKNGKVVDFASTSPPPRHDPHAHPSRDQPLLVVCGVGPVRGPGRR